MDEIKDIQSIKPLRLDVLKIEFNKKKLCECFNPRYLIDIKNRYVMCKDCNAIVDPFEAMVNIARGFDRINMIQDQMLEQRKAIANYKPHLLVVKELERSYRANKYSMVPCCPRCKEPFDLPELTHWKNRCFLKGDTK